MEFKTLYLSVDSRSLYLKSMIVGSLWCSTVAHVSDLYGYPHKALVLIDLSRSTSSWRHHTLANLRGTWRRWRIKRPSLFFFRSMHQISIIEIKRRILSSQFSHSQERTFLSSFHAFKKNLSSLIFYDKNQI